MSVISVLLDYHCSMQTHPRVLVWKSCYILKNVQPSSSVALLTLGSLSFLFFLSDLDCISRALFAVEDYVMPLKLKWAAIITIFMARVYISTKA